MTTTNKLKESIQTIINSDTGYAIAKQIGVRPHQISRLKNGERKIENMTLELASKLLDTYTDIEIKFKGPT